VHLFTSGGLGLGLVILLLVLRIWSCLHHCLHDTERGNVSGTVFVRQISIGALSV